jgi:hypothetical protein
MCFKEPTLSAQNEKEKLRVLRVRMNVCSTTAKMDGEREWVGGEGGRERNKNDTNRK